MEKAMAFINAVAADENLAKSVYAIKNKEELLAFAASHGHDLTEQDLNDIVKMGSVCLKQKSGEPLSDEELELVSGGIDPLTVFMIIYISYVAIATGVTLGVTLSN